MPVFWNISNHSSKTWSRDQIVAAEREVHIVDDLPSQIIDVPFPNVEPDCSKAEVEKLAEEVVNGVNVNKHWDAILVQGEMTLTYAIVAKLKEAGVRVVAATSKREVEEAVNEKGETIKNAVFKFVQFREY